MRLKILLSLFLHCSHVFHRGVMPLVVLERTRRERLALYQVYFFCVLEVDMLSMLSSDADTTTLGVHACGHVHGCKLLEHKLGGVWDDDLCDLGLVLARSAFELVLLERARNALVNMFIFFGREQK
jgi:hypothetical protein